MELDTKRLILRELTEADFPRLYEILSDPEGMRYYPAPYDEAGVRRWITWNRENYAAFGFGLYAVVLKETGEMIGDCGVTMQRINGWIKPEIGYHIHKSCWRQGYASEAASAWRDYIFTHTPFNMLYSYMNSANVPSAGVAVKNGMRLIEEYTDTDGQRTKVYAVTRSEWQQVRHV